MDNPKLIEKDGIRYALIYRKASVEGVKFFTEQTDEYQVGVMERPKGYRVEPHTHPRIERSIEGASEFLYIESGKVEVQVFDDSWVEMTKEELRAGDFILFLRGGHALTLLEPTRMIEVKQGPYLGEKGKVFQSSHS